MASVNICIEEGTECGQGDFSEQEFEEVALELVKSINYEGFEFISEYEIPNIRCHMHRKYRKDSGLYEYKLWGHMLDVPADTCASTYVDLEYRNSWDEYCVRADKSKDISKNKTYFYWQLAYPFPLYNRDYCFVRETRKFTIEDRTVWVSLAKSEVSEVYPVTNGIVRVGDYFQKAALMSDGKSGTLAYMSYYDNPEGYIPTWLINWVASTGGPQYLNSMHKSCHQYLNWKMQRHASDSAQTGAEETSKRTPKFEGAKIDS